MSPCILQYRLLRNWEIHSWNFSSFNLNGSWGHLPSNIFHTPSTIVLAPLNLLQLISNHLHLRMSQLLFQQQSVLKYRSNMAFMCLRFQLYVATVVATTPVGAGLHWALLLVVMTLSFCWQSQVFSLQTNRSPTFCTRTWLSMYWVVRMVPDLTGKLPHSRDHSQ